MKPYVLTEPQRLSLWGDPCVAGDVLLGPLRLDGRIFSVNQLGIPAFEVWEAIRAVYDYKLTGSDTGFYNCRHMRHDPSAPWSVHAWAMALDVNWLENPAGNKLVTDSPDEMIDDLLAVRTVSGARVFRWGGDWDWDGQSTDHSYVDAMHWEVVAHPLDLETGFTNTPGDTMLPIVEGDDTEDQTALADMLNETSGTRLKLVEPYDSDMVAAVKEHLGEYTGHPDWKEGRGVGGKQYSRLIQDYIKKVAPVAPAPDLELETTSVRVIKSVSVK